MGSGDGWQSWLDRVVVDATIFELRPDYCAGLMVIPGVRSGPCDAESEDWLARAERTDAALAAEQIEMWREAYRSFGAKPKRTPSSLDALVRRARNGLPRINRVTDIYNAISVIRGVPIGVEDAAGYVGDMRLVRARGDEGFLTTDHGVPVEERPEVGEPIWRDDVGVTCRRWNWRQTTRTALTEQTEHAVVIVDALGPTAGQLVGEVLDDLANALGGPSVEPPRLIATRCDPT